MPENDLHHLELDNRIEDILKNLSEMPSADDRMQAILEVLTDVEVVPTVGNYYTFVYSPKTPNIRYDNFPLVAVTGLFRWGFRAINFHWDMPRNYTWEEVVGNLHVVRRQEMNDLIRIGYAKFRYNYA